MRDKRVDMTSFSNYKDMQIAKKITQATKPKPVKKTATKPLEWR